MIRKIFIAASMLSLGACATTGELTAADQLFLPAGPLAQAALNDDAAYTAAFEEEVRAARALVDSGGFSVTCNASGQQYEYRVGEHVAVMDTPHCGEVTIIPTLVRRKVVSDDSSLLMVIGNNTGVISDGAILRVDRDAAVPLSVIPIDNLWVFGPFLAENRAVIVTGEITPTGCGIIRRDKELTLDWERGQISAEREIPSPPLTCAEAPAG